MNSLTDWIGVCSTVYLYRDIWCQVLHAGSSAADRWHTAAQYSTGSFPEKRFFQKALKNPHPSAETTPTMHSTSHIAPSNHRKSQ